MSRYFQVQTKILYPNANGPIEAREHVASILRAAGLTIQVEDVVEVNEFGNPLRDPRGELTAEEHKLIDEHEASEYALHHYGRLSAIKSVRNRLDIGLQKAKELVDRVRPIKSSVSSRVYDRDIDPDTDILSVAEWNESVRDGIFVNYDGSGYWVKYGRQSRDEVFETPPEDATHVAWYNK